MTVEPCWHPDLLRRFVPTPYVFSKADGPNRLFVESNDLEIALGIHRAGLVQLQGKKGGGLLCKLIRDMADRVDNSEITIISDGALRVLYLGPGTMLIHDQERSELFGFVARNLKVEELVSSLIPGLLNALGNDESALSAFTKK
jgi:hypothetical protein